MSEAKQNSKAVVWVVGAVAVVAIVFLLVYGGSGRLHLELPFGVGAEMAGERAAPPPRGSVSGEDLKAGRDLAAESEGGNVDVTRAEAARDLTLKSQAAEGESDPK